MYTVITLVVLVVGVLGQCTKPVRRRELKSLSSVERFQFLRALQKLHQKRNGTNVSEYEKYAGIHESYMQHGHGHPMFLPWHRQFIRNLEKDLQEIDSSVVFPYWDWTIDAAQPERSYIFQPDYLGGNGQGDEACVGDGPFQGWNMSIPETHCLARDFDGGETISPFVSRKVITHMLQIKEFSKFSERLEVAHGAIHNNVGGERGDLLPMWSPNE
ncbi:hypothetical protein DSO57_1006305 [Entomophthora muscae]|uniref:Uncharacterized protein n=1 Tax=Entomophthora muscae TaxID=34485 RepID=A0ACC2T7Z3_9FUNG|nr:hypothetical protein DSO57_1006305 [Entomophthora muscae]